MDQTLRRWRCPECGHINEWVWFEYCQWCDHCEIGFESTDVLREMLIEPEGASDARDENEQADDHPADGLSG
jgi:hypothetical protein